MTPLLDVENLHVSVGEKPILNGLTLRVNKGEVHAIMGPNGSGKSTLSHVIAGRPGYTVTSGDIRLNGESILDMEPEDRARRGVFLAFQYPIEIPGVNNLYFLKMAYNAIRKHRGLDELDAMDFLTYVKSKMSIVGMKESLLERSVNEGFSGGEKKRNEIFQMALLDPALALLDETDSGLDIDALRVVASGIDALRSTDRAIVMVTHYQRLLEWVVPDFVHVLAGGKIVRSGDKSLALELEEKGYAWLHTSPDAKPSALKPGEHSA